MVPIIDARRDEVYMSAYELGVVAAKPSLDAILSEKVVKKEKIKETLDGLVDEKKVYVVGSGASRYEEIVSRFATILPPNVQTPSSCLMALFGLESFKESGPDDPSSVEPNYLREPDAKLPTK